MSQYFTDDKAKNSVEKLGYYKLQKYIKLVTTYLQSFIKYIRFSFKYICLILYLLYSNPTNIHNILTFIQQLIIIIIYHGNIRYIH